MRDHRVRHNSQGYLETSFTDKQSARGSDSSIYNIDTSGDLARRATHETVEFNKRWRMRCRYFPWRHFISRRKEEAYAEFKKNYFQSLILVPALAGFTFASFSFGLNIYHFADDKMPTISLLCIAILTFVAMISLKLSDEIPIKDAHSIATVSVICLLVNIAGSIILSKDADLTSYMNIDWATVLVFLTFVAVPVKYWKCVLISLVIVAMHSTSIWMRQSWSGTYLDFFQIEKVFSQYEVPFSRMLHDIPEDNRIK